MSDLITIPWEDNFETTLTQSRNGGVGDVFVNDIPTSTIATGEKSYIVVNPGKSNMQVARVSGWTSSPSKKFVVDSITVDEWNATAYTQKIHAANSVVRFSNNYQFWKDIQTAVNSKVDSSELGNFTLTGSQIKATGDMKFKDDNNVELTLSTLAAGNGADQKVAITTNDTTTGTLNDKLLVGSGLTKTINNPWGAETMTIAPDTSILATKSDLSNISSLSITSDYPLGEPITDITKSCTFKETAPTFAQASTAQNIWDVAGNTRVSFPAIGTGVAGNSLKLALAKNWSPSAFLRVRIETDNAGNPSGTLVDANATKDIDPATLTTSLADTTVTFPWSFTVANGTKVHTVVSAVWDVVNASNYYKIGYSTNDTTTRGLSKRNTTRWAATSTIFPYISSTLFHNTVLSLTDSDFAYKVDLYGIATATGALGSYPKLYTDWFIKWFSSLTDWSNYYLSWTPWAISTTVWTNPALVGQANWTNTIRRIRPSLDYITLTDWVVYQAATDGFVSAYWNSDNANNWWIVLYIWLTSSPSTILSRSMWTTSWATWWAVSWFIKAWWYYSWNTTFSSATKWGKFIPMNR